MRTKIKLLTCFERLSSERKIGFSIGSIAVMTFPLFSQVYIFNNLLIFLANLMEFFQISDDCKVHPILYSGS